MDERETDDDDALDSFPNRRRRRRRLDVGEEAETRRANGEDARARAMPSSDDALRSLMSYEDEEEEEAEALPAGWRRARDAKSGRGYYYNKRAKQSSWTRPVETRAEGGETRDATVGSGGVSTVKDERAEADHMGGQRCRLSCVEAGPAAWSCGPTHACEGAGRRQWTAGTPADGRRTCGTPLGRGIRPALNPL